MSTGRVLRRNLEAWKKIQEQNMLKKCNIRTFLDEDDLELLSLPSQFQIVASSATIKTKLDKLRKLAAYRNFAYLTDVQSFQNSAYFVIHKDLKPGKWTDSTYNNFKHFNLYINPKIIKFEGQLVPVQQKCFSFPYLISTVDRYSSITLNYTKITNLDEENLNINSQLTTQKIQGFKSLVAQHCVQHLGGKHFLTPYVSKGKLQFDQKYVKHFPNSNFILKQYKLRVKKAIEEGKCETQQFKKMKQEYEKRLRQHFKLQFPKVRQFEENNMRLLKVN